MANNQSEAKYHNIKGVRLLYSDLYYSDGFRVIYADYKEKYEEAIKHFDNALRLDPDNPIYLNNRGGAYSKSGDYKRALDDFETALRINPTDFVTRFNRNLCKNKYEREEKQRIAEQKTEKGRTETNISTGGGIEVDEVNKQVRIGNSILPMRTDG